MDGAAESQRTVPCLPGQKNLEIDLRLLGWLPLQKGRAIHSCRVSLTMFRTGPGFIKLLVLFIDNLDERRGEV